MQVADLAVEIDDGFPVKRQDHAEHAVRRRMLRPHVQNHLGAVEQGLLSCGDFYLVHGPLSVVSCPLVFGLWSFTLLLSCPFTLLPLAFCDRTACSTTRNV